MSNTHKGAVSFEAGGFNYVLFYSADALAELEDAMGMGVNEIGALMQDTAKFRLKMVRTVFWAGLLDHQPGTDIDAARAVLRHLSGGEAIALIGKAFAAAFPADDSPPAVGGGAVRPPQPDQDGTGPVS